MAKTARSMAELNAYLISIMQDCLEEVLEKVNEKLKERIQEDVYNVGDNNYYARGDSKPTGEFKDSVTSSDIKVSGSSVSGEVYHDFESMSFSPDEFIHSSRYWKDGVTDIRELLPKIINDGLSGGFFGSGWWENERPYFDNTLKELESSGLIRQWFKNALQSRGVKVV